MIWKILSEFDGRYEISDTGLLRNQVTQKEKDVKLDREGYVRYYITFNGKQYMRYAHRLVAHEFIENVNSYPVVHHKNNVRNDNNVSNLEWCTQKYNRQFAYVICQCCGSKVKV